MKNTITAEELLKELENRLSKGDFKDSVHKIKLNDCPGHDFRDYIEINPIFIY
jgi:hypothetical protein